MEPSVVEPTPVSDRDRTRTRARARLAWVRWTIALAAIGFWAWLFIRMLAAPNGLHAVPFERWYGNWRGVFVVSAGFLTFILAFLWPRGQAEWRNAGMCSAFLISLFVEMFGLPLTIFVLAPLLEVPAITFGLRESHLWAYLLDRAGLVPLDEGVHLVMTLSLALIALGMGLLAVGWGQVFRGRDRLVTSGLYRMVRHPQYLGLILIVVALIVQWPTILTLAMAPVLIAMYVRQARHEDEALAIVHGEPFHRYAERVPAFVPRLGAATPGVPRQRL